MVIEAFLLDFLVPSWWEIKVTVAASAFVIFSYWFFSHKACANGDGDSAAASGVAADVKNNVTSSLSLKSLSFLCSISSLFVSPNKFAIEEGQCETFLAYSRANSDC